jgi:hypothetical protein
MNPALVLSQVLATNAARDEGRRHAQLYQEISPGNRASPAGAKVQAACLFRVEVSMWISEALNA